MRVDADKGSRVTWKAMEKICSYVYVIGWRCYCNNVVCKVIGNINRNNLLILILFIASMCMLSCMVSSCFFQLKEQGNTAKRRGEERISFFFKVE